MEKEQVWKRAWEMISVIFDILNIINTWEIA